MTDVSNDRHDLSKLASLDWIRGKRNTEKKKAHAERPVAVTEPEHPKTHLEEIAELINENFDVFSNSVEEVIDTLYKRDFTKEIEPGAPDDQQAMKDATDGIQAINVYIDILKKEMATDEGTALQVETLAQQRDRLSDAIVGYTYRMTRRLNSGEEQVNELISQVANGTLPRSEPDGLKYETNQDFLNQKDRFKNQPDIADRYAGLLQIDQIINKIFTENKFLNGSGTEIASFSDISSFIDEVTQIGDSSNWSEEDNRKARLLIKPLETLFDVPVFGEKAKEKYDALKSALEDEVIKKTFTEIGITDEKGRVYDLDFVLSETERLTKSIDAFTWKQKDVRDFLLIARALKELSTLPVSGEKVKQVLEKFSDQIQTTIEAGLKTDKVPALIAQGKELIESQKIPRSDKEFYDVVADLEEFVSEEATAENRGWIVLSREEADHFIDTIIRNKEKIAKRITLRFKLETSDEKKPKTDYCQAVEDFVKGYAKSQKKLELLLPIINELGLTNSFGKKEDELNPSEATENPKQAAA